MNVRSIHSEEDRAWALGEIEQLWDRAEPGTPEGERFDVLITLVEAYEREHFPIPPPDPIDAILFRMEQAEISRSDLLPILGTTARVSEILNRRRRLTLDMIRALSAKLEIPMDVLARTYRLRKGPSVKKASRRKRDARVA